MTQSVLDPEREVGSSAEATVRALIYVGMARGGVDERGRRRR